MADRTGGSARVRLAVTGGIGSGKSTVSALLAARGAWIVDADQIAREVVEPGSPGLAAVVEEFGTEFLDPDGGLDRARMAALVFADRAALRRLETILEPLIEARSRELDRLAPDGAVVVHDIPLLADRSGSDRFDLVIVVDAADDVRLARLVGSRGMDEADARARMAVQAKRADMLAIADLVIDNNGTDDDLPRQVDAAWASVLDRTAERPEAREPTKS
jgi:dephospho-CoA kinase